MPQGGDPDGCQVGGDDDDGDNNDDDKCEDAERDALRQMSDACPRGDMPISWFTAAKRPK